MINWQTVGSERVLNFNGSQARVWMDRDTPTYMIRTGTKYYASSAKTVLEAIQRCERILFSSDGFTTYSGVRFYPFDPTPGSIKLIDIAHASSMISRFGGHAPVDYKLGQHCVLVAKYSDDKAKGLLHDATEALGMGDLITSTKRRYPEYVIDEHFLTDRIFESFGLTAGIPENVHIADKRVLAAEFRDIRNMPDWGPAMGIEPIPERIECWSQERTKNEFLAMAYSLGLR